MIEIDIKKCNGCSSCVEACPQQAITVHDSLAVINQGRCNQCGICLDACPAGAISEVAISYTKLGKGGRSMAYGFGGGLDNKRGAGFGFKGDSLPWPYVGTGRGGLPRCQCPVVPSASRYGMAATSITREREIDFLKSRAEAIKSELSQVESRISDLETSK